MANEHKIEINKRENITQHSLKQLRREGNIPGIYYSTTSKDSLPIFISQKDYYTAIKSGARIFNILVDNKKVKNAFCMPGGKIAVFSGMLEISKDNDGLATILGHEIAHAVAKHSIERQSQAMAVNLTAQVADIFLGGAINRTRNTVGRSTGLDIFQLGIMNPFGRKQETEADYLGLIFTSLAGFNIKKSVALWERMRDAHKGKEPPAFLSTHPSSKKRIENLSNWINQIILEYPPMKN